LFSPLLFFSLFWCPARPSPTSFFIFYCRSFDRLIVSFFPQPQSFDQPGAHCPSPFFLSFHFKSNRGSRTMLRAGFFFSWTSLNLCPIHPTAAPVVGPFFSLFSFRFQETCGGPQSAHEVLPVLWPSLFPFPPFSPGVRPSAWRALPDFLVFPPWLFFFTPSPVLCRTAPYTPLFPTHRFSRVKEPRKPRAS